MKRTVQMGSQNGQKSGQKTKTMYEVQQGVTLTIRDTRAIMHSNTRAGLRRDHGGRAGHKQTTLGVLRLF